MEDNFFSHRMYCPPGRFEVTRPLPSGLVLTGDELLQPEIGEATGNDLLVPDLLVQLFLR